jgi:hypothetical protein
MILKKISKPLLKGRICNMQIGMIGLGRMRANLARRQ